MQLHGRLRTLSALASGAPAMLLAGQVIQSVGTLLQESVNAPWGGHPSAGAAAELMFLAIISPPLLAFIRMAMLGRRCDQLGTVGTQLLSQTDAEGRNELHDDAECTDLLLRFMHTVQAVPTGWFIGPTRAGPAFILKACLSVLLSVLKTSWSFFFPHDWAQGQLRIGTILFATGFVVLIAAGSVWICLKGGVQIHGSPTLETASQTQLASLEQEETQ